MDTTTATPAKQYHIVGTANGIPFERTRDEAGKDRWVRFAGKAGIFDYTITEVA